MTNIFKTNKTIAAKTLLLALAIATTATLCPNAAWAQNLMGTTELDGVTYKLYSDNTASIPSRQAHESLTGTLTLHQTISDGGQDYTLTEIESHAFAFNDGLNGTLTIPNTVTSIGDYAFYSCDFTGELLIPNSVQSVGELAFTGLFTSIVVGDGVTSIVELAFATHGNLTSVVLGANVQTIGNKAFWDQTANPTELQVECKSATPPTMGTEVFKNRNVVQVTVPPCTLGDYQASDGWNGYNLYEQRINAKIGSLYYVLNCSEKTATVTHAGYTEQNTNNGTYKNFFSFRFLKQLFTRASRTV